MAAAVTFNPSTTIHARTGVLSTPRNARLAPLQQQPPPPDSGGTDISDSVEATSADGDDEPTAMDVALWSAASRGSADVVQTMVDGGGNPSATRAGFPAVSVAISMGRSIAIGVCGARSVKEAPRLSSVKVSLALVRIGPLCSLCARWLVPRR